MAFHQKFNSSTIVFFILFFLTGYFSLKYQHPHHQEFASESKNNFVGDDFYSSKVKPIFENRCVACHGCFQSPCQVNFQSYEGITRGIHKHNVYEGSRPEEVSPTRLFSDGKSVADWRRLGFRTILEGREKDSILSLALKKQGTDPEVLGSPHEQKVCPQTVQEYRQSREKNEVIGMPYGLPSLTDDENRTIHEWLKSGAGGPSAEVLAARNAEIEKSNVLKAKIESYLNHSSPEQKLLSRYLYEHLFLASIYFPENSDVQFRLIRSKTNCENPDEILTRRPNDDPKSDVHYCLVPGNLKVVEKTYLPYPMSEAKLEWIKKLFTSKPWTVKRPISYDLKLSANPFVVFQEIPVELRYRFLLEDSQYHIMTFIKGPVCEGSNAVNSISEHFYVFFFDPNSDLMVRNPNFEKQASEFLQLPGEVGSLLKNPGQVTEFIANMINGRRNKYREKRFEEFQKQFIRGYSYKDIWDGDGANKNALLTVIRNNESATVFQGGVGDLPKNFFVLDYALIERLVYNLVVNFDVYGNFTHQVFTRLYMALLRMEAEENFLAMMPVDKREDIYLSWYKGFFATTKNYWFYYRGVKTDFPVAIDYQTQFPQKEFTRHMLYERFSPAVRGAGDDLNWRVLAADPSKRSRNPLSMIANRYRQVFPVVEYFPDLSFILVESEEASDQLYSVVKHKDLFNNAWISGEGLRRNKDKDSLLIYKGVAGPFPNQFFLVKEQELIHFSAELSRIKSEEGWIKFQQEFGISRNDPRFWNVYDRINKLNHQTLPVSGGTIDLLRFGYGQ